MQPEHFYTKTNEAFTIIWNSREHWENILYAVMREKCGNDPNFSSKVYCRSANMVLRNSFCSHCSCARLILEWHTFVQRKYLFWFKIYQSDNITLGMLFFGSLFDTMR